MTRRTMEALMLHQHAFRAGDHVRKDCERRARKMPMAHTRSAVLPGLLTAVVFAAFAVALLAMGAA